MIDSREQYDFVTIDDDIIVNGDIMPQRDSYGDGQWRVLRGEDVAFCLEGAHERAITAGTYTPDISAEYVDGSITSERWIEAISALYGCAEKACTGSPSSRNLNDALPSTASISNVFPGVKFDMNTLVSDPDMFAPGEPLRADPVRDVFRDLKKLRAFEVGIVSASRTSDGYSYSEGGDGVHQQVSATGNVPFSHSAVKWPDDYFLEGGGWSRAQANSGNLSISTSSSMEYVAGFDIAVEMTVTITKTTYSELGPVSSDTENHHYILVNHLSGNVPDYPMASLGADAKSLAERFYGGPLPTHESLEKGQSVSVTVRYGKVMAVCHLGDHTDFSHIAWN